MSLYLLKKLRKAVVMAKRNKAKAKQQRSGTSPYVKYQKKPFQYSADYYNWRAMIMGKVKSGGKPKVEYKQTYAEAAE